MIFIILMLNDIRHFNIETEYHFNFENGDYLINSYFVPVQSMN
jgi:hypothetical protein